MLNLFRKPRSYLVAVYPNGRVFEITKRGRVYWWDTGRGSFPLSAARENVEAEGGRVERRYR
jgi:hypothetical protein